MKLKKLVISIVLVLLTLVLAFSLYFGYCRVVKEFVPFDEYNVDTWFNPYNFVLKWETSKLHKGMDYNEIYAVLGRPLTIAGSGHARNVYPCLGGGYLYVDMDGDYRFYEEMDLVFGEPEIVDRVTPAVASLILAASFMVFACSTAVFVKTQIAQRKAKIQPNIKFTWKTLVVLLLAAVALFALSYVVYIRGDISIYDPNNEDTFYDENNVILPWEAELLQEGMTFDQIIQVLGKPNRNVGAHTWIVEYVCLDGRYLYVYADSGKYALVDDNVGWEAAPVISDYVTPAIVIAIVTAFSVWSVYALWWAKNQRKSGKMNHQEAPLVLSGDETKDMTN